MQIYDLIRAEHAKARSTAQKLEDSAANRDPAERERLLRKLNEQLGEQTRLEDDWLLPLLVGDPRTREAVDEARLRRDEARRRLDLMPAHAAHPARFGTDARILSQLLIELGIYEERELFPRARQVIPDAHARDLALLAQGKEPPPVGVASI